ncbi:MAG: SDR family oxidoreductase [Gammaproteobacteria bacterium]|nr:SDR family oxidoreductase [Gammaproteobacteria bacterium]MYD75102.1 SDR family oxidoreductase [Gammaproteobacteria bacterium]MYJ52303.1 SDR family oxidoreductase [Gammaproteobacteria bacterium]
MPDHRVAVVTGGLRGIGLAIVRALADSGVRVAVGSRQAGEPEASRDARLAIGETGCVETLDVVSLPSVERFMEHVRASLGEPDILVNCAGVTIHHVVEDHPDADWERVIDINLNGPFRMIRSCIPSMKRRGWGRIVNIASTAARIAQPTHAAYCASKTGLVGLTRAVAMEGAPHGVTCVAVSPTWVETEMLRQSARTMAESSGKTYEEVVREMAQSNPQNRLVQPDEIGALVAFCCSDAAAGLTMEDIQVNAGAWW